MWKKDENPKGKSAPFGDSDSSPAPASFNSGPPAVIGSSLIIDGTIHGDEDLLIEGTVKVDISLPSNVVTVGTGGTVEAKIHAAVVVVEGAVRGDLVGEEQVEIRRSGNAQGNIVAPRVGLEDGAQFKGNIDMSNQSPSKRVGAGEAKSAEKGAETTPGPEKPDAEKVKNVQASGPDSHANVSK